MNEIHAVSTLLGAMTVAAGIDAGIVSSPEVGKRILVVTNDSPRPELEIPFHQLNGVQPVLSRFDAVCYLNDLISPFHPSRWLPEHDELPLLARLLRHYWGLGEGPVRLYLDSLNNSPSLGLIRVFHDALITVVPHGLTSYSPTESPPPLTVAQRLESVVYLEVIEGLRPLLLGEHGVEYRPVSTGSLKSILAEMADAVEGTRDGVPDLSDQPTSLVVGQNLSAGGIFTPAEQAGLEVSMIEAANRHGARRVAFKPHDPLASPASYRLMAAEAERLGMEFSLLRTSLPAEAVAAATSLVSVVSCCSTALVTIPRVFGVQGCSVGADVLLGRLTPYQDSKRIPVTVVDALTREDTRYRSVPALQRLIETVAYCMQAKTLPHLRETATGQLLELPNDEIERYFRRRRLTQLNLPGGMPAKPPQPRVSRVRSLLQGLRGASVPPSGQEHRLTLRRAVDVLIVVVVTVFCTVSICRAVIGVGALPYVTGRLVAQQVSESPKSPVPWRAIYREASLSALNHPLFLQWWGERRRPRVAGNDYLLALAKRPLGRTLGAVLGVVVSREIDAGVKVTTLVMPEDIGALVGTDVTAGFERADGSKIVINLRHPEQDFEWLSGVDATVQPYDPLLDNAQFDAFNSNAKLVKKTTGVLVAETGEPVSGTWILFSRKSSTLMGGREFLLVPIEMTQDGAAQ